MSGKEIDNFLIELKKQLNLVKEDYTYQSVNKILINLMSLAKTSQEVLFIEEVVKKMTTDFYAYNLFKLECDEKINVETKKIVDDICDLNDESDLINYIKSNTNNFIYITSDYYRFHNNNCDYINKTIANIVNKSLGTSFSRLYNNFFKNDYSYKQYLLSNNINKGLYFIKKYNDNQNLNCIKEFLNNEFDSKVEKNHFINYILSNVYVYLKINKLENDDLNNLVLVTEKLDFRMYCYYDDEKIIDYLFKTYYNLYKDCKWFNFNDIRDNIDQDNLNIVKKLDNSYIHPSEVLKDANDVFSITQCISDEINDYIISLIDEDCFDKDIIDQINKVILGDIKINHSTIFNDSNNDYFITLLKLLIVSNFYEYSNLICDELDQESLCLLEKIDDDMDVQGAIDLFNDPEDSYKLIDMYYEYCFSDYQTTYDAMMKIVKEKKLHKIFKMNPYCILDYRKRFGLMFPFENSMTVDLGNDIISLINNILFANYSANVCDDSNIFDEISQLMKLSTDDYGLTQEQLIGFVLANIYEHLKAKKNITEEEKDFILNMEEEKIDFDDIINDDTYFGQLLNAFYNFNIHYFDEKTMTKLRRNTNLFGKINVLKKYDPYYFEDKDVFNKK